MADTGLAQVLQSIVGDPSAVLDLLAQRLFDTPPRIFEYALDALNTDNTLDRAALLGLLFDTLDTKRPTCTKELQRPLDPMRDPASGFTIRDVVVLPESVPRPTAHLNPGVGRVDNPSAVPMIIEVTDVGLEARPDLVGVVETALYDEPTEATQILRAFVAGYRGFNDCPDETNGRPELSAVLTQLVERQLGTDQGFFASGWLRNLPWTAVMAAPLEQGTFGAIIPGEETPCAQTSYSVTPTDPVPIAPPNTPETFDGSGSDNAGPIQSIQNLWALAIPEEVSAAVDNLFLVRTVLRHHAQQVVYVPTQNKFSDDAKRFLGQANFDQQTTLAELAYKCCLQGRIEPGTELIKRLATLAIGDKSIIRQLLSDETIISISQQLLVKLLPWDRRTELVPSDLYLLKPIPSFGVALSVKVRIWQANIVNAPFVREVLQDLLAPSLRAVLSPCDVATFTPDPLLCVAKTGKMPPGTTALQVSSTTNNYLLTLNTADSSATPTVTLFRDQTTNAQAAAPGPNITQPSVVQVVVAEQAWSETEAPSRTSEVVGTQNPSEPQLGRKSLFAKLFPLGDMYQTIANLKIIPLSQALIILPLDRREPISTEAFIEWVNLKLWSFRSFRTPAMREAIERRVPTQFRVYLGLIPPLVSAVQAFLSPQIQLRQRFALASYRPYNQSFSLPRGIQSTVFQGQTQATGVATTP